MGDSKVKVAVRIRPMNRREIDLHTKCVVDVDANKVILNPVNTNLSKGDARAAPEAYRASQSRGLIRAVAASLHDSRNNVGSLTR